MNKMKKLFSFYHWNSFGCSNIVFAIIDKMGRVQRSKQTRTFFTTFAIEKTGGRDNWTQYRQLLPNRIKKHSILLSSITNILSNVIGAALLTLWHIELSLRCGIAFHCHSSIISQTKSPLRAVVLFFIFIFHRFASNFPLLRRCSEWSTRWIAKRNIWKHC